MSDSSNDSASEKPKIIVDSDWKEQVRAEREQLSDDQQGSSAPQDEAGDSTGSSSPDEDTGDLPPASFPLLVTSLATQAAAALGQIADPHEGKPVVNRPLAKHAIDTLALLQDKTKGNLTSEEESMLESILHQLRVVFIASSKS